MWAPSLIPKTRRTSKSALGQRTHGKSGEPLAGERLGFGARRPCHHGPFAWKTRENQEDEARMVGYIYKIYK